MLWTKVESGQLYAVGHKFLTALGENAGEVVARGNSDPEFVKKLAEFAVLEAGVQDKKTTSLNPQWLRAREIMGKNFFGVEEAIKHFGITPSKQWLTSRSEIPFSEEVLVACKDTHILVAVLPMSILDIRAKVAGRKLPAGQKGYFYKQDWYDDQAFAKNKGELGWRLVRKTSVHHSNGKTWDEQQALLGKDEETPSAQVMIYMVMGHFLATGKRLFQSTYVRCIDLDSGSYRVCVGSFGADGYRILNCWDDHRAHNTDVSSARKLQ